MNGFLNLNKPTGRTSSDVVVFVRKRLPRGTAVELPAGYFCAIFPGEAHMVGGRVAGEEDSIAKWVVKVPCTEDFEVEA